MYDMIYVYKVLLRDGVGLISWGRRKSKRENADVPMICMGYCLCYCCMLRLRGGMRSDDVCFIVVASEVKIVSLWFDPFLLLCTNHTRTPWLA